MTVQTPYVVERPDAGAYGPFLHQGAQVGEIRALSAGSDGALERNEAVPALAPSGLVDHAGVEGSRRHSERTRRRGPMEASSRSTSALL
jgi:hypothetical protein